MSSPEVVTEATSVEAVDTTTHDVTMPAGLEVGDGVAVFWATDGSGASDWEQPVNWYRGWTDENQSGGCNGGFRFKVADGTEGVSVAFTTTSNEQSAHHALRLRRGTFNPIVPFTAARAEGTTANPDAPSHNPAEGDGGFEYLWVASFGADLFGAVSVWPTNYVTAQTFLASSGDAGACSLATARRNLATAGAEDPSAWTIAAAENWVAGLVAFHPVGLHPARGPLRRWNAGRRQ